MSRCVGTSSLVLVLYKWHTKYSSSTFGHMLACLASFLPALPISFQPPFVKNYSILVSFLLTNDHIRHLLSPQSTSHPFSWSLNTSTHDAHQETHLKSACVMNVRSFINNNNLIKIKIQSHI